MHFSRILAVISVAAVGYAAPLGERDIVLDHSYAERDPNTEKREAYNYIKSTILNESCLCCEADRKTGSPEADAYTYIKSVASK
jgi:hypothetical protein